MRIEKARMEDVGVLIGIYEGARVYMASMGNSGQWVDGYPGGDVVRGDIDREELYVCRDVDEEIVAVFCFAVGEDPTYDVIYDGEWLAEGVYGVVHRIASSGKERRVADYCLEWCFDQVGNMRIDTHVDNMTMRRVLERCGYKRVGVIVCHNGTEREAYHRIN